MASGSGSYDGGRQRGTLSAALLRGRKNANGGNEMSARQYYRELRNMGASRQEALDLTREFMKNTTLR